MGLVWEWPAAHQEPSHPIAYGQVSPQIREGERNYFLFHFNSELSQKCVIFCLGTF